MQTSYTKKKNLSYTYTTRSFAGEVVWDKLENKKRVAVASKRWYDTEINKLHVGDKVSVNVTNKKPKRTEQQNRYLWGIYYDRIAQETGENDVEYLHECFKKKFLVIGTKIVFGEEVTLYRSTTKLSVGEFCKFVMDIETLTGIAAPPPENYDLAPLKINK